MQVNLAYRWFCKLGIEDAIPDHPAFSRARNERFREEDVFRQMFERVVRRALKPVWWRRLAVALAGSRIPSRRTETQTEIGRRIRSNVRAGAAACACMADVSVRK